jgi:hypothetical protein
VGFGYRVSDYEEWCKTWPIKTAANPGNNGRGNTRNKADDVKVTTWVREFFNLGGTKKRRVDRVPSRELPKVMNSFCKSAEEDLGLHVNSEFIRNASIYDRPDFELQADYLDLSLADLYRQTGEFEKARNKTMVVLSVLGNGDGKISEGEKKLQDSARKCRYFSLTFFFITCSFFLFLTFFSYIVSLPL